MTSHFDKRGATYDQAVVHHRVAAILAAGAGIRPGWRVLDIATGTGLLAFRAARLVEPGGQVLGIDLSAGMLAEAQAKAEASAVRNVTFARADAERLVLPPASFDCVCCASALVMMSDIPRALRLWCALLKPGGTIAFDTPAKPFGIAGLVAEIAGRHGIRLDYADIADRPARCRSLLQDAGFEVTAVRTELVDTSPIGLDAALAFWDDHCDHPAWHGLRAAPDATRAAIRSDYIESVSLAAAAGPVRNDTALNFTFGRKPS